MLWCCHGRLCRCFFTRSWSFTRCAKARQGISWQRCTHCDGWHTWQVDWCGQRHGIGCTCPVVSEPKRALAGSLLSAPSAVAAGVGSLDTSIEDSSTGCVGESFKERAFTVCGNVAAGSPTRLGALS
uniref:Uncharacterized protein n=1 Tax=Amblyomma tuberculatum TaxID=48802 RepID=A0A6M2E471_9ACAR